MTIAKGIAALLIGLLAAAAFGLIGGFLIGALILAAPLAWAWDAIASAHARRTARHPR